MTIFRRFLFALALPLLLLSGAYAQKVAAVQTCPLSAIIADQTTATTAQMVAIPTNNNPPVYNAQTGTTSANPNSPQIRVCSVNFRVVQPGTPTNYGLVYGTGSNCATAQGSVTPQFAGTASVTESQIEVFGFPAAVVVPAGNALCFKTSAVSTHAQVLITYAVL